MALFSVSEAKFEKWRFDTCEKNGDKTANLGGPTIVWCTVFQVTVL